MPGLGCCKFAEHLSPSSQGSTSRLEAGILSKLDMELESRGLRLPTCHSLQISYLKGTSTFLEVSGQRSPAHSFILLLAWMRKSLPED